MKNSTVSKTSQEHKQLILLCGWNSAQEGKQHKIFVHVWATDCQSCVILLSHICCMWGLPSCKTEVKGLWALPELSQGFSGRATSPHSAMAPAAKTKQVLPRLPANPAHVHCQGSEAGLPEPGASQAHFAIRQNINTSLLKSTNQGSLCSWPQRRLWSPAGCSQMKEELLLGRAVWSGCTIQTYQKMVHHHMAVTCAESRARASVGSPSSSLVAD